MNQRQLPSELKSWAEQEAEKHEIYKNESVAFKNAFIDGVTAYHSKLMSEGVEEFDEKIIRYAGACAHDLIRADIDAYVNGARFQHSQLVPIISALKAENNKLEAKVRIVVKACEGYNAIESENQRLRERLEKVRFLVVEHSGNGEILNVLDEDLSGGS